VRVLARDVSVQLQAPVPAQTSIQNHLPAVVVAVLADAHPAQALLHLRCGEARLLARVTRRAVSALDLVPGKPVWAQVKSVAVMG
jgi:molybdate transport system ATP-binding protein